jgi:hypothetical protein
MKIRALKGTSGSDNITPNFIILLNQAVPGMEKQQSSIMQSLNCAITRGNKLLTSRAKENLDMMFTKLI